MTTSRKTFLCGLIIFILGIVAIAAWTNQNATAGTDQTLSQKRGIGFINDASGKRWKINQKGINADPELRHDFSQALSPQYEKAPAPTPGNAKYISIRDSIVQKLTGIGRKINQKSEAFTPDELALVSLIPTGVLAKYKAQISALGPEAEAQVAESYADLVTLMRTYNIMAELYGVVDDRIRTTQADCESQQGTASGSNSDACNGRLVGLYGFKDNIVKFIREIHAEYSNEIDHFKKERPESKITQAVDNHVTKGA